jgi:serine/threonine-protein kinase
MKNCAASAPREEQILASLSHPNIARLYGGAVTADHLPYFVMKYVEGTRLDDSCQDNRLSIREMLAPNSQSHSPFPHR